MVEQILIFGVSGHARTIAELVNLNPNQNLIGFVDNSTKIGTKILSKEVVCDDNGVADIYGRNKNIRGIIGVGNNAIRSAIAQKISILVPEFRFTNGIHPSAIISESSTIGRGCVCMAGTIINAGCTIHDHCIINTQASLDHDCSVGSFTSLGPNSAVGGGTSIGNSTQIGISACIFDKINIGHNCIIGGGSVVNKNVKDNSVYYGNPAKFIRSN